MPKLYAWKNVALRWTLATLLMVGVYRETGLWTMLAMLGLYLCAEGLGWGFHALACFIKEAAKSEEQLQGVMAALKERRSAAPARSRRSGAGRAN